MRPVTRPDRALPLSRDFSAEMLSSFVLAKLAIVVTEPITAHRGATLWLSVSPSRTLVGDGLKVRARGVPLQEPSKFVALRPITLHRPHGACRPLDAGRCISSIRKQADAQRTERVARSSLNTPPPRKITPPCYACAGQRSRSSPPSLCVSRNSPSKRSCAFLAGSLGTLARS
jgi:hypothetical protein